MFIRVARAAGVAFGLALAAAHAPAAEQTFNFKDPKGVNSMAFTLDSELEPIRGIASGISGEVVYDPQQPATTTGRIVVQADSLRCSNPRMTEVLHGEDWLNVAGNPQITFEFARVQAAAGAEGGPAALTVSGEFTCNGVTRTLTIPVRATHLPGKAEKRLRRVKGDLLVLRTDFTINRKDFGIKPEYGPELVAEQIHISAQIVGICPTREPSAAGSDRPARQP